MATRVLALLLALAMVSTQAAAPAAADQEWQKGITLWGVPADYGSPAATESLRQLQATGANSVGLVVAWYVHDSGNSVLRPGWNTPTDAELIATIEEARGLGLDVVLHLHVDIDDGTWRGYIDPRDEQGFFAAYGYFLRRYAKLAEQHGAAGMVVGSELVQLTGPHYTQRWLSLIADARARFSGYLTYGAQWGAAEPDAEEDPLREYAHIEFWPELDYLGIAAYFNVGGAEHSRPDRQEILARWAQWRELQVEPLQAAHEKPVIFTEIGYRSTQGAASRPWDHTLSQGPDVQLQADLYGALLEAWGDVPWFKGVYFWYWSTDPDAGGTIDEDYTPQNKPAMAELVQMFANLPVTTAPAVSDQE